MNTWTVIASCWAPDPIAVGACVAAGVTLAIGRRKPSRVRAFPFAAAVAVLVLALASPIGQLADGYLFSAHMLQHLMLVLVVPPLAMMGLQPLLAARPPSRIGRFVLRPVVAWGLGVGAMWLWHERALCDAAIQSALVHRVQEISLLAMGTAFWVPVLAPRDEARLPPLAGVLYLFTACVACTLLGILITFSPVRVCSVFAHPVDGLGVMPLVRDGWGLSAERDQQIGGLLMWVPACLVYGVGILGVLARLFHEPDAATTEGAS
jgi:cytochrome c oxidase assembly factor CtaG